MMKLALPVDIPYEIVGELQVRLDDVIARLGPPHAKEDDSTLFPGRVVFWAYELEDGTRFLIELYPDAEHAAMYAVPPDVQRIVATIGLPAETVTWVRGRDERR